MEIYILLQEDNTRFTFAVIVVESTLYTAARIKKFKKLIRIIRCKNEKKRYRKNIEKIEGKRCVKNR